MNVYQVVVPVCECMQLLVVLKILLLIFTTTLLLCAKNAKQKMVASQTLEEAAYGSKSLVNQSLMQSSSYHSGQAHPAEVPEVKKPPPAEVKPQQCTPTRSKVKQSAGQFYLSNTASSETVESVERPVVGGVVS
ncbi:hypothetical protein COOONC_01998 [Cooperia oncophora]